MTQPQMFLQICHDRSGSNLLKAMINQHPEIYVIPPIPIFEIIYYYQEVFGDLEEEANWQALLAQVSELYDANHHPLPCAMGLPTLRRRAENSPRTLGGAVQCVFDHIAEHSGKSYVGLKFGAHHSMVADFLKETRFQKAVYQTRDPRDVALSVWKAGVDNRSPSEFAAHWIEWHRAMIHHLRSAGIPYVIHRYEDLLEAPEEILAGVWDFLGVPAANNVREFYKADVQKEAAAISYMWRNVDQPLNSGNKNKFYLEWGPKVTRAIERAVGWEGLSEFGYESSKLWRFPLASFFNHRLPEIRKRTLEDGRFQEKQNAIAASLVQRYTAMKRSN